MKKVFLIIFILILPLSFLVSQNTYNFYNYFKNFTSKRFCFIYNQQDVLDVFSNVFLQENNCKLLKNGDKQFVYFDNCLPKNISEPQYMQVEINSVEIDVTSVLNRFNAKVIKTEFYEGTKILYAFTTNLKKYTVLNNKKVNLQFAINLNSTTIGYPMIYGSF